MLAAPPPTVVRSNTTRTSRDALAQRLADEIPAASIEPGTISPFALRLRNTGDLTRAPSFTEGLFAIQEEGAQAVALATGVRPGARVLDACAGRGGKTTALAAMLEGRGVLHAVEMYPEKVRRIDEELDRLGLRASGLSFASAAADIARGLGTIARVVPEDGYDCILLDAPCSGLGTLGRRPDILSRAGARVLVHDESDGDTPARESRIALPDLQRALLDAVAPRVRPGGLLVYAVCTLTVAEGLAQIESFRGRHPAFVPCEGDANVPERLRAWSVTLRPDLDGTDGFQVFRLRKSGA
jgi:16S rRNA (cytosine967-C5)-methyltransferase